VYNISKARFKTKRNEYFCTVEKDFKDIAIVLLNWNGRKFLEDFLPPLVQHSATAKLIVIDNASSDDSVAYLKAHYPKIEIIINTENYGFAGGYNEGLKHINSPYYLLINTDVEVSENWLKPLYERIQMQNIVAVQPKILSYAQPSHFEHAGAAGGYIDKNGFIFCRGRIFDLVEEDTHQYDYAEEVFWTSGACMLVERKAFWEAGAFDAAFFAHMEEIDLCWRLKRMGHQLWIEPKSTVYHVGGGTLNYDSPRKTYLNYRNSLFMLTKNSRNFLIPRIFIRMILDGLAGLQVLSQGKFKFFTAILKAHFSFYGAVPKLVRQRAALKKQMSNYTYNDQGWYTGNIIWAKFVKKIKRFEDLNQRLFR
jgi:GT2 family glycosyltransferase